MTTNEHYEMRTNVTGGARPRYLFLLASLMLAAIGSLFVLLEKSGSSSHVPRGPMEARDTNRTPRIIGDLGGVPVVIPTHFAEHLEYDGDPGWAGPRNGPVPVRTYQSRLMSFGYEVRFPDMVGQYSNEIREDRRRHSPANTPWVTVSILSGERYPGEGYLDRQAAGLWQRGEILKYSKYEAIPSDVEGLVLYAPAGNDPTTGKPHRLHPQADDVYVHRAPSGQVLAIIACTNRMVSAPPCRHSFSLAPRMRAAVDLMYRRQRLREWKDIQEAVSMQIRGFAVSVSEQQNSLRPK